jgi:hypothetical protein
MACGVAARQTCTTCYSSESMSRVALMAPVSVMNRVGRDVMCLMNVAWYRDVQQSYCGSYVLYLSTKNKSSVARTGPVKLASALHVKTLLAQSIHRLNLNSASPPPCNYLHHDQRKHTSYRTSPFNLTECHQLSAPLHLPFLVPFLCNC